MRFSFLASLFLLVACSPPDRGRVDDPWSADQQASQPRFDGTAVSAIASLIDPAKLDTLVNVVPTRDSERSAIGSTLPPEEGTLKK